VIYVCVGTYPMQFNRLLSMVDQLIAESVITDDVYAQTGASDYDPIYYPHIAYLEKSAFDQMLAKSDLVVCHAGMGIINNALEMGKTVIAVPRRKKHKEHVNDHQLSSARAFSERGHIILAENQEELVQGIKTASTFQPEIRSNDAEGISLCIAQKLSDLDRVLNDSSLVDNSK